MTSVQPMLLFAEVPITCPTQAKYHAIAPCLAGAIEPKQQAKLLNLSYSTVSRWLKQFREEGLAGLVPTVGHSREPYTPSGLSSPSFISNAVCRKRQIVSWHESSLRKPVTV